VNFLHHNGVPPWYELPGARLCVL